MSNCGKTRGLCIAGSCKSITLMNSLVGQNLFLFICLNMCFLVSESHFESKQKKTQVKIYAHEVNMLIRFIDSSNLHLRRSQKVT